MAAIDSNDWTSLSKLNPELEAMLPAFRGFKLVTSETTVESYRALVNRIPPSTPWSEVLERDIQIPIRDGTFNLARVYSPSSSSLSDRPLMVCIHGGGWVLTGIDGEAHTCRTWAKEFGGIAVNISYRCAPEHPWPVPHEDIYDAIKWIAANHKNLGADASKAFIIGGSSSGAISSTTMAYLWRDEGLSPPVTGLHLSIPAACIVSALPEKYRAREKAWEQNRDAPIFDRAASDFMADLVKADPLNPTRSPLLYRAGHGDLPPTWFAIAGADPWRDIGLLHEEMWREAGVKTKLEVFPGLFHGAWGMIPTAEFATDYREKSKQGLKWLLEQSAQAG